MQKRSPIKEIHGNRIKEREMGGWNHITLIVHVNENATSRKWVPSPASVETSIQWSYVRKSPQFQKFSHPWLMNESQEGNLSSLFSLELRAKVGTERGNWVVVSLHLQQSLWMTFPSCWDRGDHYWQPPTKSLQLIGGRLAHSQTDRHTKQALPYMPRTMMSEQRQMGG